MLKASENPNCENGFENIEIDCLTLFCPNDKSDKAFCALTQRKTMKTFLATKPLGKITFQTESFLQAEGERGRRDLVCGGLWWSVVVCGGLWWGQIYRGTLLNQLLMVQAGGAQTLMGPGPAPSPGVPWPQLHFPQGSCHCTAPRAADFILESGEEPSPIREKKQNNPKHP